MRLDEAIELAKKYRNEIAYHNKKYYEEDSPEIDDYEYDMLLKKLENLEKDFPEIYSDESPTRNIGGKVSVKFSPVVHKIKMESLHDSFSIDELFLFDKRIRNTVDNPVYVVEPKVDGLSVSIEYRDGTLFRASTRGDGITGEDITENIFTIKELPKQIDKNIEFLEVRGEVYMSKDNFYKLVKNQESNGLKAFKNPRNAAAGSLRQKDVTIAAARNLEIFIFNIQKIIGKTFESHKESIDFLKNLGFPVLPFYKKCYNFEDAISEINRIGDLKSSLPFQIDGAVIKIDLLEDRKVLGSTSKFPRWAEAFKYPPEEKETKLLDIEVNVGRTGVLTPTGILHPVLISGTTISRVVLHNQDFIDEKDIRIGDTVMVRKAGEIIPEVSRVVSHLPNSKAFKIPVTCPSCNSKVVRIDDEVALRCINSHCPSQLLKNLIHFVSQDAMDIEGLGEGLITKLVSNNKIKSVIDVYELSADDLVSLERMGKKSSQNVLKAINDSKKRNLDRLIFGLGIRHVGKKAAKIIASKFETMENLMKAKREDISSILGLGEIVANSVISYFENSYNVELVSKLAHHGLNMVYESKVQDLKFNNKIFVLTGSLKNYTRGQITQMIEDMGGKVSTSVSKNTSYVLVGDNAGSKLEKANKLGIKIISEADFEMLL